MDAGGQRSALASPNPNPNSNSIEPKKPKPPPKRFVRSQIPASILSDPAIQSALALLPPLYDFELPKTLHRLSLSRPRRVALQLPDGLLMYSLAIADLLLSSPSLSPSPPDVLVLADPTYGACCVDDFAADALGADLLIHYGHSCLVPVTNSRIPALYIFVDIRIDPHRLANAVVSAIPSSSRLALASTVQFLSALPTAKTLLNDAGFDIVIPQSKPLSPGEVLGCTAPCIPKTNLVDALIFVADGRFHLEAFMIVNPSIPAFRYDPFLGVLVREEYDHDGMKRARKDAILEARKARTWGVVLGTLGRQGNTRVLDRVTGMMEDRGLEYTMVLMSELSPARIALFGDSVDAWVQIACPRLSIDWGEGFAKPLLTTFEFDVAMGNVTGWWERRRTSESKGSKDCQNVTREEESCSCSNGCGNGSCGDCNCDSGAEPDYPMDYYAQDGGDWNSSYAKKKPAF